MKILYLFTLDYNREIADCEKGAVPTHRLWGYVETTKMGHEPIAVQRRKFFGNNSPSLYSGAFTRRSLRSGNNGMWIAFSRSTKPQLFPCSCSRSCGCSGRLW